MSADVLKKYSPPQEKRIKFLERVEHYINKCPRWTPAEGALLVNGVMPPAEGCKDIPEIGSTVRQLDEPDMPATETQLNGANRIFLDYLDHVKHGDLPPGDEVLSDDFLIWCYDSDPAPWNAPKLPEFLRHLYFPGTDKHPFSMSVEDELASLKAMVGLRKLITIVEPSQSTPLVNVAPSNSDGQLKKTVSSSSENVSGLLTREKQIRAIESGAKEKGYLLQAIPNGGKKALGNWCLEHYKSLFVSTSKISPYSKFNDAWRVASKSNRIVMADRDVYGKRK